MKHSAKVDGRPAFQWYPDDWLSDAGLRMVSLAARGLWMDMLCMMFNSPERGNLRKQNGTEVKAKALAKSCGVSEAEIVDLWAELEDAGVFSRRADGTIYSRRMVRDEHIRTIRAEAGRRGGRPSKTESKAEAKITPPSPSPSPSPTTETTDAAKQPAAPVLVAKKANKVPTGDHAVVIDHFCQAFKAKTGHAYPFSGGKDGKLVADLLRQYTAEQLKGWIDKYLAIEDEWSRKTGYSLGMFKTRLAEIISRPKSTRELAMEIDERNARRAVECHTP